MFGFGNDEDEYQQQQPREKSFLSKIGSFLMKWVVLPILAVAGIGLLFKIDAVKDFADKHLGGIGSKTLDILDTGWNKVKSVFGFGSNSTPTSDDVSRTEQIGNTNVLFAKPALTDKEIVENAKVHEQLSNLKKSYSDLNASSNLLSLDERKAKTKELDELRPKSFEWGKKAVVWDKSIDDFKTKNPSSNAPTPPKIGLEEKLPAIPEELEKFGREKIGDAWSGLSKLSRIEALENSVYAEAAKKPDLGKRSLREEAGIIDGRISEIFRSERVPEKMFDPMTRTLIKSELGRKLTTDKDIENSAKREIKDLLEHNNLTGALKLSADVQDYFNKTALAIAENGSKMDKKEFTDLKADQQMVLYRDAAKNFGEINDHIKALQRKETYINTVGNPTHKAIADSGQNFSVTYKDYAQKIDGFTKDSAARDATPTVEAAPPTPPSPPAPAQNTSPPSTTITPTSHKGTTDPKKLKEALANGIQARGEELRTENGGSVAPKAGTPTVGGERIAGNNIQ